VENQSKRSRFALRKQSNPRCGGVSPRRSPSSLIISKNIGYILKRKLGILTKLHQSLVETRNYLLALHERRNSIKRFLELIDFSKLI
jgi:hypothetical protein